MYPVIKSKYYTFQEVLNLYPLRAPAKPHDTSIASDWFTKMLEDAGLEIAVYTLNSVITDDVINEIINSLMTIVYDRHSDDYFYQIDMEYDEDVEIDASYFPYAVKNLINVIDLTLPKYVPLLQQNEFYSANPVAPIGSETTGRTRFNDTPQNDGGYNDDEHSTNESYSVTNTAVDSGSIVSRLDEAFKNFRSIILEWSNEFNRLFFKEEQL